jgi:hypothetical protein
VILECCGRFTRCFGSGSASECPSYTVFPYNVCTGFQKVDCGSISKVSKFIVIYGRFLSYLQVLKIKGHLLTEKLVFNTIKRGQYRYTYCVPLWCLFCSVAEPVNFFCGSGSSLSTILDPAQAPAPTPDRAFTQYINKNSKIVMLLKNCHAF